MHNLSIKHVFYFIIEYGSIWFTNHGNKILPYNLVLIHWWIGRGAGSSKVQDFAIFINNLAFDYHISDELLMASKLVDQMFPSATEGKRTPIITTSLSSPIKHQL